MANTNPGVGMHRIVYMPLHELKAAEQNPKKHLTNSISDSMDRFGYVEPLVLDERTGRLVAGHGRREALLAKHKNGEERPEGIQQDEAGEWYVPVVRGWGSADDAEAAAFLLAANQLTTAGGWDEAGLRDLLDKVRASTDVTGLGWSEAELDALLAQRQAQVEEYEDGERGLLPEEKAAIYDAGLVKQIVLVFEGRDYEEAIALLAQVRSEQELETNTDAVLWLLRQHVQEE